MQLQTTYLGIDLKNPLVASSSPISEEIDRIREIEDAGGAAVVLHSLFEEQIMAEEKGLDKYLTQGTESFAEAVTYFPDFQKYTIGPEAYLKHIQQAKKAVDIPVLGSLNGISTGGWIRYAKDIQNAGADGLELNVFSIPTDPQLTSATVEERIVDLVKNVKQSVRIPVAVKIGPFFSSIPNMVKKLEAAGAGGLVLFNRFYQPDIDLGNLEVVPNLVLSNSEELRLRLRWVAILFNQMHSDLAITGGVHTAEDVVKSLLVGARCVMMTSALLKNGIQYMTQVLNGLMKWMNDNEYESVEQMQGSMSLKSVVAASLYERANYIKVLGSYR